MASDRILETARKRKVLILSLLDDAYPDCLRALADRPFFLTLRSGDAGVCLRGGLCDQWRGVGVVGTRDATPEGKGMTEWFVRQLDSESDVRPTVVVSGLAYGIDIAAHRAALRHKLPTVAVMANGLDGVYPAEHGADADRIVGEGGALVSEVLPGDTSTGGNFVERNRIIAGLSRAVVAAQCAAKSGTLYTLRAAQDQGKAIYAVTYRDKAQSPGSEALTIGIAKTNSGKKIARAASVAAIEDVRKLMRILGTPPDAPTIGSQRKIFE
jgi:DNA processing protein